MKTIEYLDSAVFPRRLLRELPSEERPINRLKRVGVQGLSNTELLALALNTADGMQRAEELLIRVGGLRNLTRYSLPELMQVGQVGQGRAAILLAMAEIGRRLISKATYEEPVRVTTPADAANYLMPEMSLLEQEQVRILLLDSRNQVIACPTLYIGCINMVTVRLVEIFKHVIRSNAACFILAHNHPSADPTPTPEDVRITEQVVKASSLLDCECTDHIIVGGHRYVSLKERGLGFGVC